MKKLSFLLVLSLTTILMSNSYEAEAQTGCWTFGSNRAICRAYSGTVEWNSFYVNSSNGLYATFFISGWGGGEVFAMSAPTYSIPGCPSCQNPYGVGGSSGTFTSYLVKSGTSYNGYVDVVAVGDGGTTQAEIGW